MKVGFTGTRAMPMPRQIEAFVDLLIRFESEAWDARDYELEFHHGDCVGADQVGVLQAKARDWITVSHPPDNPRHRAFTANHVTRPEKPYLERNRDIVEETTRLIAVPAGDVEELRSGTWSTVRYARTVGRPIWIIWPDGRVEHEPAR